MERSLSHLLVIGGKRVVLEHSIHEVRLKLEVHV